MPMTPSWILSLAEIALAARVEIVGSKSVPPTVEKRKLRRVRSVVLGEGFIIQGFMDYALNEPRSVKKQLLISVGQVMLTGDWKNLVTPRLLHLILVRSFLD